VIVCIYLIPAKKDDEGNIVPAVDLSKAISWTGTYDEASGKYLITATFLTPEDCKDLEKYKVDLNNNT